MANDQVGNDHSEGDLIRAGGARSLSGMPGHYVHGQALK